MEIKHIILTIYIITYANTAQGAQEGNTTDDNSAKQSKRGTPELSYSYAATDIGSKAGTHIKTITIIKNYGQKEKPLKINPELHKDEDWGSKFRDNFDSFGKIPEIPDVLNPHFLKKEESPAQQENPKEEIPIHEESEESVEGVQENKKEEPTAEVNQDNAETDDEDSKDTDNKMKSDSEKDAVPEDVEVIEAKSTNIKGKKENLRSQPLISVIPNIYKPQKYLQPVSALNTRPYHTLVKAPYINQQDISQTSVRTPYKLPENFKITYSPLLFPLIPIQPAFKNESLQLVSTSSTTQIPQTKNPARRQQNLPTTTQLPYIAPNLKKSYKSVSSPTSSILTQEVSNVITKTRNKPVISSRSRGLRYK